MIRQFYGMVLLFMLYCGTSLHAGVFLESTRYENGILFPNFFLTYLYATKVESKKSFTLKVVGSASNPDESHNNSISTIGSQISTEN